VVVPGWRVLGLGCVVLQPSTLVGMDGCVVWCGGGGGRGGERRRVEV
jgi:hypothetical protein